MKRSITLLLALMLVVALFAGCGGNTNSTTTNTPQESTANDPNSPYHFAPGNYEVGEDGLATAPYNYTLPLTTTDEVISYWNVCYTPQYIPDGGFGDLAYPADIRAKTGVNIEYICDNADAKAQRFAVMLASDDLPDLMAHGMTYYGRTPREGIDEGYFLNLYDYKEYIPNFLYQVKAMNDVDAENTVYYDDETIVWFYGINADPLPAVGTMVRKDWLDELNLDVTSITTFDDVYNMLTLFKSQIGADWPLELYYTIELTPGCMFSGYNSAAFLNPYGTPNTRVVNGQVEFTLTTEDDRAMTEMLAKWYTEGLIDPGWASYISNMDMSPMLTTNKSGMVTMNPSQVPDFENATDDPDVEWAAIPRTLLEDGQILQYGQKVTALTYGVTVVNAKCENIPLALTWCDYFFSPEGGEYSSYGPEGITWEYNENGEKELTDLILHNPQGIGPADALNLYAANNLCDATLFYPGRSYAYEGGERLESMAHLWVPENYGGEYDMPSTINFTTEQMEEISNYSGDVVTFILENYAALFTGATPMSEWDSYVTRANEMGLSAIRDIYQEAYDAAMAE